MKKRTKHILQAFGLIPLFTAFIGGCMPPIHLILLVSSEAFPEALQTLFYDTLMNIFFGYVLGIMLAAIYVLTDNTLH